MEFKSLYDNELRSKNTKLIKTNNGKVWKYNLQIKRYEEVEPETIQHAHSVVEFLHRGENMLHYMMDVKHYCAIIRDKICFGRLQLEKYNNDFVKISQLIKFLCHRSLGDNVKVDNAKLLEKIDEASAGGCLLAKTGEYKGKYYSYDINNSYNKFFLEYDFPTNPKFKTVTEIANKVFRIYRLSVDSKYHAKEYKDLFKTTRRWYTYFDIKIFNLYDIKYTLVEEENNCIDFDKFETNFEWMVQLNEMKQEAKKNENKLETAILKELLSSVWGQLCKYEYQPQFTETEELPTQFKNRKNVFRGEIESKYLYGANPNTGTTDYINPNQIFSNACGLAKPFILAFARYRLLKQKHKIEKKGCKVLYIHTDSIVCDAKPKYFDIGAEIGQWKQDNKTSKGIIIKNICSLGGVKFIE